MENKLVLCACELMSDWSQPPILYKHWSFHSVSLYKMFFLNVDLKKSSINIKKLLGKKQFCILKIVFLLNHCFLRTQSVSLWTVIRVDKQLPLLTPVQLYSIK